MATSKSRSASGTRRRFATVRWIAAVALGALALSGAAQAQPRAPYGGFARKLYGALPSQGNLFCSPSSVSILMQMVELGARGQTAEEIARALDHPAPANNRLPAANPAFELSIANKIWAEKQRTFLPSYLKELSDAFGAEAEQLDFLGSAEAARQTINAWVEKATHDKIRGLLPPGSVRSNTRLVLTNAIYFKGSWSNPFLPRSTSKDKFTGEGGEEQVDFMHQTASFAAYFGPDVQVLKLPYKGGRLAMVIALPTHIGGAMPDLSRLDSWLQSLRSTRVQVDLPKFKLTESYNLNSALISLGMKRVFSTVADLSGMDGKRDLYVSLVQHKAFVDVNEQGTEAAAASGGVMVAMMAARPVQLERFHADHPFVFLILDEANDEVLFVGRLSKP